MNVEQFFNFKSEMVSKMQALMELKEMLIPVSQGSDYGKELAEARNEKYGCFD